MVERKFLKAIKEYNLIVPEDKILVAFSGGIDSTVLTYLIIKFKNYLKIKEIALAHLNHSLRGKESDEDEEFAKNFAEENNLRIFTKKLDIKKLAKEKNKSIEEVAREERYKFLQEITEKENFSKIATGHHLSDLVETMILWFIQGNRKGIKGFKPKEKNIIRPLYLLTKSEIEGYAKKHSIQYRIDITNFQTDYLRNKIRLQIIPELKKINSSLENSMLVESYLLQMDDDFLDTEALKFSQKFPTESLQLSALKKLHPAIIYRVLINWIYEITGIYPSYRKVLNIMKALDKKGEKKFSIGKDFVVIKSYNELLIKKEIKNEGFEYKIRVGESFFIKEAGIYIKSYLTDKVDIGKIKDEKKVACFQIEDLREDETFIIRSRKKGDIFLPFGRSTPKKLKDVMIELRIPKHIRDTIPILEFRNKILWIIGYKRSGYFPVKNEGKTICFEIKEV